ncbi:MAG TPA: ABC transporter ATP-binding protein [Phycisphaerales bacterium]|nr:ABC transporter ATP-binding protein [Phycisphaerales bacterium]
MSTEQELMIEAINLHKNFGKFAAVRNVSFSIPRGQIVAFLGPNGAGKSTTMRLLTGYMAPTSGSSKIAGHDMQTDRLAGAKHLGYLPENGPLYPDMTPTDLLRFIGTARGLAGDALEGRIGAVLRQCALNDVMGKAISKLSRGYRQRVGMAHALLHEPDVLILDEPTAGLDPNQAREMRETIRALGADRTVLLSTHILPEVEAMADRVIMIHAGRIVYDGSVKDLKAGVSLDERFAQLTRSAA